jgi:hypothetical protein
MESNQSPGHTVRTWSGRAYRLPIDQQQFHSLLTYVEEMIAMRGCDNTLEHAQTWARAHDIAWGRLGRTLRGLGGFCDCEIAMNVVEDQDPEED